MDTRIQTQIDLYQKDLSDTRTALSTVYWMYSYYNPAVLGSAYNSSSVVMTIGYDGVAEQIRAIPTSSCSFDLEFVDIGYSLGDREDALDFYASSSEVRLDLSEKLYNSWSPTSSKASWVGSGGYDGFSKTEYVGIKYFPKIDTSQCTDFTRMFNGGAFSTLPYLDTSKVENWTQAFEYARQLETLPSLDTSKAAVVEKMFSYCTGLRSLPKLDFSRVQNATDLFGRIEPLTGLKYLGGFTGLKVSLNLKFLRSLTYESALNVINELGVPSTQQTLTFYRNVYSLLSAEDIALATAKNWIVKGE